MSGRSLLLQPTPPNGAANIANLVFVARLPGTKQKAGRGKGRSSAGPSNAPPGSRLFLSSCGTIYLFNCCLYPSTFVFSLSRPARGRFCSAVFESIFPRYLVAERPVKKKTSKSR